jgi:hypothetical protein
VCNRSDASARARYGRLLAALLRRLSYFALFPVEKRLETRDGRVEDVLFLRGAGDPAPSSRAREALRRALEVHAALHE